MLTDALIAMVEALPGYWVQRTRAGGWWVGCRACPWRRYYSARADWEALLRDCADHADRCGWPSRADLPPPHTDR